MRGRVLQRESEWIKRVRLTLHIALLGVALTFFIVYLKFPEVFGRLPASSLQLSPYKVTKVEGDLYGHSPREGYNFIKVFLRINSSTDISYPISPGFFRVRGSDGNLYDAEPFSPLFTERPSPLYIGKGETIDSQLVFEIPKTVEAKNLLFERR